MRPHHIKRKPVPLILGVEDGTQAARFVRAELRKAGLGKVVFGVPDGNTWILACGKEAWSQSCGATDRGRLWPALENFSAQSRGMVFPTFHPGYVRRRKSLLPLFRQDLRTFATFASLDLWGKVL